MKMKKNNIIPFIPLQIDRPTMTDVLRTTKNRLAVVILLIVMQIEVQASRYDIVSLILDKNGEQCCGAVSLARGFVKLLIWICQRIDRDCFCFSDSVCPNLNHVYIYI